jgi:hypothetical protein
MSAHAALRIAPRSSDEAAVRALYQQCMQNAIARKCCGWIPRPWSSGRKRTWHRRSNAMDCVGLAAAGCGRLRAPPSPGCWQRALEH